jgi:hypothetical protein
MHVHQSITIYHWWMSGKPMFSEIRHSAYQEIKVLMTSVHLYWPKVWRFRRVLHRICYCNVAHMKRASCVQHLRGMCAGSAPASCDTRVGCALLTRVCRPLMSCRCRALLARRKYIRGTMGYFWSVYCMATVHFTHTVQEYLWQASQAYVGVTVAFRNRWKDPNPDGQCLPVGLLPMLCHKDILEAVW